MEEIRSRGGARIGAGRPRTSSKRLHRVALCLTDSEAELMQLYRQRTGVKPADAIRILFESWIVGIGLLVRK